MYPTRADVARLAKVSTATVSYVINGGPRPVAPETRQRVLDAIAALGYRPNGIARSLARRRSHAIGLIVPNNANPFFAEFARLVEDRAFAREYTVILCDTNQDLRKELAYVEMLLEKQVDGVIVASPQLNSTHLAPLAQRRVPVVAVNHATPDVGWDSVQVDDTHGGFLAGQHLLWHGYRDIGCLAGPEHRPGSVKRLAGLQTALEEAGLAIPAEWVSYGPLSAESGYERGRALLTQPKRPRAIFIHADLTAIGLLQATWELGLRVPEDVAIVSFDNILFSRLAVPPLTTIAQPIAEIAERAVSEILQRIEGNYDRPTREQVLPPSLVIRRSCGCNPRLENRDATVERSHG